MVSVVFKFTLNFKDFIKQTIFTMKKIIQHQSSKKREELDFFYLAINTRQV